VNVGRPRSVRLVEELVADERPHIAVITQKNPEQDEPGIGDLHTIGTVARVVKVIRMSATSYSLVLHGVARIRLVNGFEREGKNGGRGYLAGEFERLTENLERDGLLDERANALRALVKELLEQLPTLPKETAQVLENVRDPGSLADLIASNFPTEILPVAEKQAILESLDPRARIEAIIAVATKQLDMQRVRREVSTMVAAEGKNQRELVLRQQMRTIREELGESAEDDEVELLRERIHLAGLPEDALKIAKKQLGRMAGMSSQSAEYNVTRSYVEWLADLPWTKTTPDTLDVEKCRRFLEEDHFGLEKVKRRILEYVAVRKLRGDKKGPILCFAGPPGVGKTSLGRSIARAMGRRYHRISLGGVRDEAEIRGHRRTYVGALPGRIIQAMKKVGTKNPVIVLDEIDKMGADNHGDPAAALLEVLDPAQNDTFSDHYIDTPFDLSQVVFLATANSLDTIAGPLLDRLEIIEVPGYTRRDKRNIVREFLAPKQISSHGLTPDNLEFAESGIEVLVDSYTREAGVRTLEREVGSVCRHVAMKHASGDLTKVIADREAVIEMLGPPKYHADLAERSSAAGVVTGLAWTPGGGDILFIEASKMPGKGLVRVTGNLKNVMQESAAAAVSFVRSHAEELGLKPEEMQKLDLHLHVPKGGTPKDGPSAGVTMFTALSSLLLDAKVKKNVAMTGEITLRGAILPVGGIKEKLLAAHRAGITEVLLPKRNERDLEDVPADVRNDLKIHLVSRIEEILPLVLEPPTETATVEL
jgi:ATP-dependent Lon protease